LALCILSILGGTKQVIVLHGVHDRGLTFLFSKKKTRSGFNLAGLGLWFSYWVGFSLFGLGLAYYQGPVGAESDLVFTLKVDRFIHGFGFVYYFDLALLLTDYLEHGLLLLEKILDFLNLGKIT